MTTRTERAEATAVEMEHQEATEIERRNCTTTLLHNDCMRSQNTPEPTATSPEHTRHATGDRYSTVLRPSTAMFSVYIGYVQQ